mmetsp:Transcript_15900/g.23240  ORF Transcript_15900/g.23240 Transcript_15900/m.23240 type:complete len:127 (-) Transcript_15900:436-816(-)
MSSNNNSKEFPVGDVTYSNGVDPKSSSHKKSHKRKKKSSDSKVKDKKKKKEKDKKSSKSKKEKNKRKLDEALSESNSSSSSGSESDDAPRSIITGKKIKMNREWSTADQLLEIERAAKRHYMNSQF